MSASGTDGERPVRLSTGAAGWELIGAVLGRGTFVVGPSPRDPLGEALVVVPPGVRIPEPKEAAEAVSTQEWRVALWMADAEGNRFVDVGRPSWVSVVSLAYVIGLLELECPQYLTWVADHMERRLLNACIASTPDAGGYVLPAARRWRSDAEAMLDELEIAMSGDDRRDGWRPAGIPEDLLPPPGAAPPICPERHEPRLARGWLRNFYRQRSAEAHAADRRRA